MIWPNVHNLHSTSIYIPNILVLQIQINRLCLRIVASTQGGKFSFDAGRHNYISLSCSHVLNMLFSHRAAFEPGAELRDKASNQYWFAITLHSLPQVTYSPSHGRKREKPGMSKPATALFIKKMPENPERNIKYFFAADSDRLKGHPSAFPFFLCCFM